MPPLKGDNGISGYAPSLFPRYGVWGESDTGYGVLGTSGNDAGIYGYSVGGPSGVLGEAALGQGVLGRSRNSAGVAGSANSGPGVMGDSFGRGVAGTSYGTPPFGAMGTNPGVVGFSARDIGVLGRSRGGTTGVRSGVVGETDVGFGVIGLASDAANGRAVVGLSPGVAVGGSSQNFAGLFDGRFLIRGDFFVTGIKAAVVQDSDGSHRTTYSLESPESWFEDFGRAEMVDGRARVELDSEYAALVRRDDYHVFLTPEGPCQGLYVAGRDEHGFDVREQAEATSSLTFSYRVVGKRKDIEGERLQKVDLQIEEANRHLDEFREFSYEMPEPELPEEPDIPELPERPDRR
jgi:hypothetical protein